MAESDDKIPSLPPQNFAASAPDRLEVTEAGAPHSDQTRDRSSDQLEEGLRAMQELARSRAEAEHRIGVAAKPLADAAVKGAREAALYRWLTGKLQFEGVAKRWQDLSAGASPKRQACPEATEQSERSSEKRAVSDPSPPERLDVLVQKALAPASAQPESAKLTEAHYWIYGGVGAAAFSTVFGIGLAGIFYEKEPIPGTIFSVIGFVGLIAMIALLRGHRITILHAAIASLIATWCFLGYVLWAGPHPAAIATGRIWPPLSSDEQKLTSLAIKLVPKREHFRVICLTTDCKDLAGNFTAIFHDAGWNPVFASNATYFQEPYGIVLYLRDVNDKSLPEAIEKTTNLKIDHVEASNDPVTESLFIGIRP